MCKKPKAQRSTYLGAGSFFLLLVTFQFQIIVPPRLLIFVFFVGPPFLIWTPPPPRLLIFWIFFCRIFQKLLKWIFLNKEPPKQRVNEMEQKEQEEHKRV